MSHAVVKYFPECILCIKFERHERDRKSTRLGQYASVFGFACVQWRLSAPWQLTTKHIL